MLPVIVTNGIGIDSEELGFFSNEKIANLSLTERILLILAFQGFDNAIISTDAPNIAFNRLKKKFPNFKLTYVTSFKELPKNKDLLFFQNNVVINKKQLQSTLNLINDNNESLILAGKENTGIVYIKNNPNIAENILSLNKLPNNIKKIMPKDYPIKLKTNEIETNVGRDFLFNHISKNVSGWFSKRINSKISIPISKMLIKTSIHPNIIILVTNI